MTRESNGNNSGRFWGYFCAEQHVPEAGLQVLELVTPATTMIATQYRVRFYCCGESDELVSHKNIRKRQNAQAKNCAICNYSSSYRKDSAKAAKRRKMGLKDVPFASGYHGWAPPSVAAKGNE